jgi:hypothetical protein
MSTFAQKLNAADDFTLYTKSNSVPVTAGPDMIVNGWRAGMFVMWAPLVGRGNAIMVEISDGSQVSGMLIQPSEDYSIGATWAGTVNYTSKSYKQLSPGWEPMANSTVSIERGAFIAKVGIFERVALTGGGTRSGGPITYMTRQTLYCSENGLICNDDPANLIAAGIAEPVFVGYVINPPAEYNNFMIEADIRCD